MPCVKAKERSKQEEEKNERLHKKKFSIATDKK